MYSTRRSLKVVECSYDKEEDEEEETSNSKTKQWKQPKVKLIHSFKQLQLKKQVKESLLQNGFNLFEMPRYLQENIDGFAQSKRIFKCKNSEQSMKYLMITLDILQNVNISLPHTQIIILSTNAKQIQQSLLLLSEPSQNINQINVTEPFHHNNSLKVFIADEKNSFSYDNQYLKYNAPHVVIGSPDRFIYNIQKVQLSSQYVTTLFVDDISLYSTYNSHEQEKFIQFLNFLPQHIRKYYFYNPENNKITPTIIMTLES